MVLKGLLGFEAFADGACFYGARLKRLEAAGWQPTATT